MSNKKLLVIFFIVLAIIVSVPFLAGLQKQLSSPSVNPATGANPASTSSPPPTPSATPTIPSPAEAIPSSPPMVPYYAQPGPIDFTGTVWNVPTPYGAVQVALNPGGQAVATHQMVGTVVGSWRVQGNQVIVSATFMGQTQTVAADICGNTLCFRGRPIPRIR